jgi:Domain of unknown function (DUF4405)
VNQNAVKRPSGKQQLRAATSAFLTLGSLVLIVSGFVLLVMPPGRIAHWNLFSIWALQKGQWEALHVAMALLFLLGFGIHIFLNWKPLLSYLRKQGRLFAATAVFVVVVFFLSAAGLPPFSWVMNVSDEIQSGWIAEKPPVPHFELKPIARIVKDEGLDMPGVREKLTRLGITDLDTQQNLQELGRTTGVSPAEIYRLMGGTRKPGQRGSH